MITTIGTISDIHGNLDYYFSLAPLNADLVIVPGDLFTLDDVSSQTKEAEVFKKAMNYLFPVAQDIIIVPGNHDYLLERIKSPGMESDSTIRTLFGQRCKVLVDEEYTFNNLLTGETIRIYGAPRTNLSMAFPRLWGKKDIQNIPEGIDILVTHEAPRNYNLPCVKNSIGEYGFDEPGDGELYQKVLKIIPKYHIFGHIHKRCIQEDSGITFINASQMYRYQFKPEVIIFPFKNPQNPYY